VLGLGNPGERYARTRHNAGWRVLDELLRRWPARDGGRAPEYRAWTVAIRDREAVLLAPLTYMNLSGEALAAWSARHTPPARLLVLADDVYLPVGALRLRTGGSSGGHRGLESVERTLGTRDYDRLRIGVGAASGAELRAHVLETFADDEAAAFEDMVPIAADAVECWLVDGPLAAMNRFNRKVGKEVSES
jgi:peptidyl-tRNA hydrolase, PTH1 family